MRFLLNMNTPRELGRLLTANGHPCRHVGDIGMERTSDPAIVAEPKTSHETIVTHDLDYGDLLAFSGEPSTSVIILRLRNTSPRNLFARITNSWRQIEKPLIDGAIVTLEDATLRVRPLPITRDE